jgi:H+-transporting ATPase
MCTQSQAAVSNGLTSTEASFLLSRFGYNVLEEKTVPKWQVFLSQLYQPMPIMM